MSQICIHLLRRHGITTKLCNVCTKAILDPTVFDRYHGRNCTDPRPQVRRIVGVRQQWKELYTSLRRTIDVTAVEAFQDSLSHAVNTGLSSASDAENATSLSRTTDTLSGEEIRNLDLNHSSRADCASTEIVCQCSSSIGASTNSAGRHALIGLAARLPSAWEEVQDKLPDSYKWDIEYVTTHSDGGAASGCWTCMPLEDCEPEQIPLTIAEAPVVLPVDHQWPPIGGVHPPPDPRPSAPIDCWNELPMDTIRDLFLTFEGSLGFYVLISGLLQIIVSETFDTTWASSHLPHKYGGLKVCYITNTMEPTMLQSNVATTPRTGVSSQTQTSRLMSASKQARSAQTLQLNDFIEARVSSTSRERFAGRIGLKVEKDGQPFLVMSSHVITEAILSKSFFGLNRDPMKRLQEDWNKHTEIWAGNAKIGTIAKSFDQDAEYYPTGFNHDVTLIRPNATASFADVKSPIGDLGWLCRDGWSSLRQQPSAIRILGPTETDRAAKCIKCNTNSEAIIVGEGIFFNQTSSAGAKPARKHDLSTWKRFVSRAVLYRVNPDFNPPNGYSGIALYADGTREDGTQGPGIVGFQSFVQKSDHPQKFNMPEGPHLERRLKEGRVAFYGAFQVPDELRRGYNIL
ncbi:hypothetical protein PSPO01_11392 [Paraphaeosphaeria sporulosa]